MNTSRAYSVHEFHAVLSPLATADMENQPLFDYLAEKDALLAQLEAKNAQFWVKYREEMARCDAELQALEERRRYWENQQEAAWAKLTELCEPNEHWYMAELDKLNTKYPSLRFSCDGAYVREQS